MKRIILTSLIIYSFSQTGDNFLRLPLYYDPKTNSIATLIVDDRQTDNFSQCDFQTLIKRTFEEKGHAYLVTVFRCMNISGEFEYGVASTNAFNRWIAAGGKVEPITNKPIIYNSHQNFIIEPAEPGLGYRYKAFNAYHAYFALSGEKRKRDTDAESDILEKFFKKLQAERELRRTNELFLKEND